MVTAQLGRKDKMFQINGNIKLHPFEMELGFFQSKVDYLEFTGL